MSDQERMNECVRDIDKFFREAKPEDSGLNKSLARTLREKWGGTAMVFMGFAWIVQNLRDVAQNTMLMGAFSETGAQMADRLVEQRMWTTMSEMLDALETLGPDASGLLATAIKTATDEDVRALASYMFAAEPFINSGYKSLLQEAYNKTEGTSSRIALAFALYRCGDAFHLMSFVRDGYFTPKENLKFLEEMIQRRMSKANRQERETMLIEMLLYPEFMPQAIPGIVKLLALDIASEGAAFPRFARKHYE